LLRWSLPFGFGIGRIGEKDVDAALSHLREPGIVRQPAVHGGLVELKVARVHDQAGKCRDRHPDPIGNRVAHAKELDPERPKAQHVLRGDGAQVGPGKEVVLLEPHLDEALRQPGSKDRSMHLLQ